MRALAEAGAALGVGKQVFWVSADWFSLTHHPRVRVFPTVAEAVAAILAIQSGERARAQALK